MELQPYEKIRKLDADLYCVDGEWYDTAFRRRMTVIRLRSGGLVIHSAIQMREEDLAALDQIGPVECIVVPNVFHSSEAAFYSSRYPSARVYVPSVIQEKCASKMKVTGATEVNWPYSEELVAMPFQDNRAAETAFVHLSSKTLILTDMAFHLSGSDFKNPVERFFLGKLNGILDGFGPSRLAKWAISKSRQSTLETVKRIAQYDFDRVIVNHGRIVEENGRAVFLDGFKKRFGAF